VPCHLPERITPELCAILKRYHALYINTHFNHPDELTPAAVQALGLLADAGIPLGCQTVLLKGVNDDPDVMKRLMQKLLAARVRPYYIYMCDQVAGRSTSAPRSRRASRSSRRCAAGPRGSRCHTS
jgi:lysine 2,3-aminomutase